MKRICYLLVIIQLLFTLPVFAQQNLTTKNTSIGNEKIVIHKIMKGETIFSICKKYNCEPKELKEANPQLINGLKTGETLNIPVPKSEKSKKPTEKNSEEFITHTVKKGETLFSISKLYNVPIETINKLNPETKKEVKVKQVIRIPNPTAQNKTDEQIQIKKELVENIDFKLHEIEQGETFYSLQRRYEITREQLIELNPSLKDGLQVGETIKLPLDKNKIDEYKEAKNTYAEHIVESGETVYSITKQYNLKSDDLLEMNPELKERGLISGETLFIPKTSSQVSETPVTGKTQLDESTEMAPKKLSKTYSKKELPNLNRDTIRITMFLPLFLNKNLSINSIASNEEESADPDSTQSSESPNNQAATNYNAERSLYLHSRNFLCFYEGFLMALDTMKKTGINIRLDLYDDRNEQKVVDSVLRHTDLVNSDLIVGPVEVKFQKNISAFSYKNQIPMVSPFMSDDDYAIANPFYFQINPSKDYILRKTADFIGKEYSGKNIIVLKPYSYEQLKGTDLVETVREKVKYYASKKNVSQNNFTLININEGGEEGYWGVKKSLKPDVENIVFIPPSNNRTEREAILSKAINSLYVLSDEFQITLVGMSDYPTFKSINTEYFHKLNLHFVTPNFIDYNDQEVTSFIKNYRKMFLTEPNQFSYRGYDVAKFYLEAYRQFGRNFANKITSLNTNTLQSNFKPKRIKELSGYMNKSLFVVNYSPEWEVKVASIISE
jgi:LysM repeat protein